MSKSNPTFPVSYHDFNKSNGSDTTVYFEGPSLTRQEFLEECDINTLMSKYDAHVHGGPNGMSPMQPMYADFTQLPSNLLEYMEFMKAAEASFMSLPAIVRKEMDNSPMQFVEFASDPGNLDQMRAWGLAPPAPVAEAPVAPAAVSVGAAPQAPPTAPGAPSTHVPT